MTCDCMSLLRIGTSVVDVGIGEACAPLEKASVSYMHGARLHGVFDVAVMTPYHHDATKSCGRFVSRDQLRQLVRRDVISYLSESCYIVFWVSCPTGNSQVSPEGAPFAARGAAGTPMLVICLCQSRNHENCYNYGRIYSQEQCIRTGGRSCKGHPLVVVERSVLS